MSEYQVFRTVNFEFSAKVEANDPKQASDKFKEMLSTKVYSKINEMIESIDNISIDYDSIYQAVWKDDDNISENAPQYEENL